MAYEIKKGYLERNKLILKSYAVYILVMILFGIGAFIRDNKSFSILIIYIILNITPLVVCMFLYKKDKASLNIKDCLGIGFAILYVFVLFNEYFAMSFFTVIPLLICIMVYKNVKFTAFCAGGGVFLNVIMFFIKMEKLSVDERFDFIMRIIIFGFIAWFDISISKLMLKQENIQIKDAKESKETIEKLLKNIMEIYEEVNKNIAGITNKTKSLEKAVLNTCSAMGEIATGTNQTVDAVQQQLLKTEEIDRNVRNVDKVANEINNNMKITSDEIIAGKGNIDILVSDMKNSQEKSAKVSDEIQRLKDNTMEMQSIISLIDNITEQTSLLSLNAAIESARAGELGKGFAVVANEISTLASQTQNATVDITELINNISNELEVVVDMMTELIKSNDVQNEKALKTIASFEKITNVVMHVKKISEKLSSAVDELADNNAGVVESIQTISSISEEVSAHSSETFNISEKNMDIVNDISQTLGEVEKEMNKLKEHSRYSLNE